LKWASQNSRRSLFLDEFFGSVFTYFACLAERSQNCQMTVNPVLREVLQVLGFDLVSVTDCL
jgi:hypothetical protein